MLLQTSNTWLKRMLSFSSSWIFLMLCCTQIYFSNSSISLKMSNVPTTQRTRICAQYILLFFILIQDFCDSCGENYTTYEAGIIAVRTYSISSAFWGKTEQDHHSAKLFIFKHNITHENGSGDTHWGSTMDLWSSLQCSSHHNFCWWSGGFNLRISGILCWHSQNHYAYKSWSSFTVQVLLVCVEMKGPISLPRRHSLKE